MLNPADFDQLLQSRRSIRRYTDEPLSRELIDRLLTAATWAPSAHNRQPWRFVVIDSAETKHRLAVAMGNQLRIDLSADTIASAMIESDIARSYARITGAPALILLCLTITDMDSYPDKKRRRKEWIMAVQSVAMAGQNLLLAAHAHGLGACWMCAPLFCPDVVRSALSLPIDWEPQGLITLGNPAQSRSKTRRKLDDVRMLLD
ncbi:MAG: nitroreductase family protein [Anaerolineae bacterium]|nr:nitroreductase family protein [Anaerolineae bacterium]